MKLGVLTPSLSRVAGGMFWSVRALTHATLPHGWQPTIFAGEDRYSSADRALWNPVKTRVLQQRGPRIFGFLPGLEQALCEERPDVVHVHGLWMYTSVASNRWRARSGLPYLVSPHGMLDPWALRNSRFKKRVAGVLFEDRHLRNADCLRALCSSEASAMRAIGLKNPICVIPNGVEILPRQEPADPPWRHQVPIGSRVLLYIGRIHPKKNLPALINAWALNDRLAKSGDWHIVIAGWDQGGHEQELRKLATELQVADTVHFIGPIFDEIKEAALASAKAFVLPSLSEGLPMAVLEAWAAKLPVFMTDACNLPEGFDANAAVRLPLGPVEMAGALNELLTLSPESLETMGLRGFELVKDKFTWASVGAEMAAVYRWLTGQGEQPDCVIPY